MFRLRGITRNVVILGWVSLLTDLASEMLYPVMPLFLMGLPGGSPLLLGWIDGLAEGVSSGLRWLGGALSDRFQHRKPFVATGYAISAFSKPIMGLAAVVLGWPLFLVGRIADRFGKSIRTSARDALIADSTDPTYRGVAFGLHRAMDTTGAIIGPLLALGIVVLWVGPGFAFSSRWGSGQGGMGQFQNLPLMWLFFIALVPGLFSVLLTILGVREIRPQRASSQAGSPPTLLQAYPWPFWHLILANAVFSLGNSSDSFLILRSSQMGLSFGYIILAFALYNAVYALASVPLGKLSDLIGRKPVIISGWITYALVYAGFAVFRWPWAPLILFGIYGLYQAFTEGVTKAMISDLVPSHQRAGAIGLFYTVSGLGQLLASVLAGLLWEIRLLDGHGMVAFAMGSAFALAAVPIIATVPRSRSTPAFEVTPAKS
ncbi:MAG: MFS transporter [Bacillota bacterium]